MFDTKLCILCGGCLKACPKNAIYIDTQKRVIDKYKCINCNKCKFLCPISNDNYGVIEKIFKLPTYPTVTYSNKKELKNKFLGNYDLTVIGGEFIGLISSLYAAKQGANVLFIDNAVNKSFNFQECVAKFNESNFFNFPLDWIKSQFVGIASYKDNNLTDFINLEGVIIDSKIVINQILNDTKCYGVKILKNSAFIDIKDDLVTFNRGYIKTKFIIVIAPLILSDLTEPLLSQNIGSVIQYTIKNVNLVPNILSNYYFKESKKYYLYVVPVGLNTAYVGICIRNKNNEDLLNLLNEFVFSYFPNGKIIDIKLGTIPINVPIKNVVKNNIIFINSTVSYLDNYIGTDLGNTIILAQKAGEIVGKMVKLNLDYDYLELYQAFYESCVSMLQEYLKMSRFLLSQE